MSDHPDPTRRQVLTALGAAGGTALLSGCVLPGLRGRREATAAEKRMLATKDPALPIVQYRLGQTNLGSVLRTRAVDARPLGASHLRRLDRLMRASLKRSGGVGLAAPQVGLSRRVVLVQLQEKSRPVLTCIDPVVRHASTARVDGYEACLSVAGVGGLVTRPRAVELTYYDLQGRRRQRRSSGWEARIFFHELDHLDGRLYVDRVRGPLLPIDEMRRRRRRGAARDADNGPAVAAFAPAGRVWL